MDRKLDGFCTAAFHQSIPQVGQAARSYEKFEV